jgi:hypothetical protein
MLKRFVATRMAASAIIKETGKEYSTAVENLFCRSVFCPQNYAAYAEIVLSGPAQLPLS